MAQIVRCQALDKGGKKWNIDFDFFSFLNWIWIDQPGICEIT